MARKYVRENVPLSRFGVLVAQLESIVASSAQQSPDAILCFDLLSDLLSAINEEPKDSILLWQRKCEDALYSLLILGARRPVRHLASVAMAKIILKGDNISVFSRASSLQGFLSDGKRNEPQRVAGAAQCLGEIYRLFGRKITSGLLETTIIATKLMKFHEEFVRQEALHMLENALEGSGGTAAFATYNDSFRLIVRSGVGDKSFTVRIAAARCLKAFANIGGPGLGIGELDNSANSCLKALEDPVSAVRDAFAEALAALLALGLNPDAQVQPRGKNHLAPLKKTEGGLQRHLATPFMKANGTRSKDLRIGITLSWVFFLQTIRMKYLHPDGELQNFAVQVMDMLHFDGSIDAHALACVLYILRVGVTDQMLEPTQRDFLIFLGEQLQSSDVNPSMKVAALRTLSYTLKTLGEVPPEFKEILDDTVVSSLSDSSQLVRIEAALTLRALAEVDPICVGGLVSYGVTILNALRESVLFFKGSNLKDELDSLHGQAAALAALVTIFPKLPLGYPVRLPQVVLDTARKMLTECSQNLAAATVEREAGWLLLASLLASTPKEELEDQVFDVLSLWASLFKGNSEHQLSETDDIISRVSVWSAAIDALTSFVRCFDSPDSLNRGILLQPVVVYLSRALSNLSLIAARELADAKPVMDIFVIRMLIAYQSLSDPVSYKSDHPQIIQVCTAPFRDPPGFAESSCLRLLLDKRDAWLGPWIPGRDWFEDELRAFEGRKDGLMPCIWNGDPSAFPQPESISKMLVNQMLLCFGIMFASQDSSGMLSLLGMMEQCLKSGKKQLWYRACVTNTSVGLLAGLKALLALHPHPLELDVLNLTRVIFLSILSEGDICASQRRASGEGLGLLARLGNDIFTAQMTRLLLGELLGATDKTYAGSIAFSLGCIHRSAGGMALSSLVPSTVSSISSSAKSSVVGLKIWSLHGLLLTIEAAGLSFISHVQATLGLAMDILLSEENGQLDLLQGVGRLVNACVAVLGPELAPGSIFFSRCKSVVAEISSQHETATLLESVRFTQQLVLFAPQAVSVHSHVQTLLPTLSSKQPTLRHLAISTLRHLIEKDAVTILGEGVEDDLFHMLDEETDSEIGSLVRATIMTLLYASSPLCPSRWISICRKMVLATSVRNNGGTGISAEHDPYSSVDGNMGLSYAEDDENMVSSSEGKSSMQRKLYDCNAKKHLRFRTRIFAAECLSHLPSAVGKNPAHFDLILARKQQASGKDPEDWLVLQLQELISLAYQISTMQFESMQPIGVRLLTTIVGKFEMIVDPELPGHLLLEQYQAQLVSAIRSTLNQLSGPVLLEAGMQLATKVLTSGIISGDQVAVKRIFSLISRPLNDYAELYYPSFAEWVSCKIKIRLLAAHASLKCHIFTFLRRHQSEIPEEFGALAPLFSKSSSILGKYWIFLLKDYSYICFRTHPKQNWKPFLDEILSPGVSLKLQSCLEEAWPMILQALALDAVPANSDAPGLLKMTSVKKSTNPLISGYRMVELEHGEFQFLWGFALLVLFQGVHSVFDKQIIPLCSVKAKCGEESPAEGTDYWGVKLYEVVLPVFRFLSTERFFHAGFLTMDTCKELLQVFAYSFCMEDAWNSLAMSVLAQIVQSCPGYFLENDDFAYLALELCFFDLYKDFERADATLPESPVDEQSVSLLLQIARTLMIRFEAKKQQKSVLPLLLIGYKCMKGASSESCISKVNDFIQHTIHSFWKQRTGHSKHDNDDVSCFRIITGSCLNVIACFTRDSIKGIHLMQNKSSDNCKLLQMKLALSLEQTFLFSKLAYEFGFFGDCLESVIFFSFYVVCVQCFQEVFADSDAKILTVGLQVMKSMLQKGTNMENNLFLLFLSGELFWDLFSIIHKIIKKPLTRDSVVLIGECVRILVLLETLTRATECYQTVMKLLLEAILMLLSTSDGLSQEVNDMRNTAVQIVSHLAHIPSAAAQLKDVLLGMPLSHRQLLQGIIRASVAQDSNAGESKSNASALTIKLPARSEEIGEKDSPLNAKSVSRSSSQEEDDDWDSFQSFSAARGPAASDLTVESVAGPRLVESSGTPVDTEDDAFHQSSGSPSLNVRKEMMEAKDSESAGGEHIVEAVDGKIEILDHHPDKDPVDSRAGAAISPAHDPVENLEPSTPELYLDGVTEQAEEKAQEDAQEPNQSRDDSKPESPGETGGA